MMKYQLLIIFIFFQIQLFSQGEITHDVSLNKPIMNWLVAGAFPNPPSDGQSSDGSGLLGFKKDFLETIGGENNASLNDGKKIIFTDFNDNIKEIEVFKTKSQTDGILSFDTLFPDEDFKVAYVYAELFSEIRQKCVFLLGSDDGVKVWLNGKLIHSNDIGRGLTPREDKFEGIINKGKNRLLVKVSEYVRGWEVIVEPLELTAYEKILEQEKEKIEFYDFLTAELTVPTNWESEISFYAGKKFPSLVWNKPSLVEKVAGELDLTVKWFNSNLDEVSMPIDPGMYAYYAEGISEKGYRMKRSGTLYAYPHDWYGWTEAPKSYLEYQPLSTIDLQTWETNKDVISKYVGRIFNRSSLVQGEASILFSFLDNQKSEENKNIFNTPIIYNSDYHTSLKRKILSLENKWPQLKKPQLTTTKSIVLSHGTEKDARVKKGTKEKLRSLCKKWFTESNEPFDILIARDGVIILNEAFGEDGYGEFTTESPTEIASITKMLTGLIFAQFVDQGLINIDSFVGEYLPDFKINSESALSLRNCFTHTSGLFGHGIWGGIQNPWMDNVIANLIPRLSVNKSYQYNGVGYNLAGKVMEIVSGKSMFRLFQENLFLPLEMFNTFNEEDLAYGTHSTAHDLAIVGQMVLNKGSYGSLKFFSEDTFEKLLPQPLNNWYTHVKEECGIGITWMRNYRTKTDENGAKGSLILGPNIIGHGSATSSILQIDLENNLVITQSRRKGGIKYNEYLEKLLLIIERSLI